MTGENATDFRQRGGWFPGQDELEEWIESRRDRLPENPSGGLRPSVQALRDLIDGDPVVRMLFTRMIDEVPSAKPYRKKHIQSVEELLWLIDDILVTAPAFGQESMVSTPLAAILDWTMGTPSGYAAYRDPRVNAAFGRILDAWCEFLNSPASLSVLNDSPDGWKSDKAREVVGMDQFDHDPHDQHWGYRSWNDFFTRRFRVGERPVESPGDDRVIVSACESTPYKISRGVHRHDEFWVKNQPYSLADMLANDPSVDSFEGGTVYQAFLSATNYHRWHTPVSGTIVRAFVQPGTYFSEADSEGSGAAEPPDSQGYLAHVAARAIILTEADNPGIGLVAFVAVGMIDVSSCVIGNAIRSGEHVAKGDELGYFQFGGSSHCLVFRPGVIDQFSAAALPQDPSVESVVRVRTRIATATH